MNLTYDFLLPLQRVLVGCNVSVMVMCDCCRPYSNEARIEARISKMKRARSMRLLPSLREDYRENDALQVEFGILRRAKIFDRLDSRQPEMIFIFGNSPGRRCWDAILLRAFAQLPKGRPLGRLLRSWSIEVARLSVYHQRLCVVEDDSDRGVVELVW